MIRITQIFRFIILSLIFLIIGYLVISFIKYDLNPSNWLESERASILLIWLICWLLNLINENENKKYFQKKI